MDKKLVYLHIPHTCGRSIKRTLWEKSILKDMIVIHNGDQMIQNLNNMYDIYFVLREPLERIIGEYKHYSVNLKTLGMVNHLEIKNIMTQQPTFDLNNILDYCNLEVNKNVYCKFLLFRKDFNKPVTIDEFNKVKELFTGDNKPIFDIYTFPLELPILSGKIGQKVEPKLVIKNSVKDDLINNKIVCQKIQEWNSYDFLLYDYLFELS